MPRTKGIPRKRMTHAADASCSSVFGAGVLSEDSMFVEVVPDFCQEVTVVEGSSGEPDENCLPPKKAKNAEEVKDGVPEYDMFLNLELSAAERKYHIGKLEVFLQDTVIKKNCECLKIYVKKKPLKFFIAWSDSGENCTCQEVRLQPAITLKVLQGLQLNRYFTLVVDNSQLDSKVLCLNVYLSQGILSSLNYASEPVYCPNKHQVQHVLAFFCGFHFEDYNETAVADSKSTEDLYNLLYSKLDRSFTELLEHDLEIPSLIPTLRPYQLLAVKWMLYKEKLESPKCGRELHPLFTEYTTLDGHSLYFHKYGVFFTEKNYAAPEIHRGGILADEMGLGKTVEILALILLNPQQDIFEENLSQISHDDTSHFDVVDDPMCSGSSEKSSCSPVLIDSNQVVPTPRIEYMVDSFAEKNSGVLKSHFSCNCSNPPNCSKKIVVCQKCNLCQHLECVFGTDIPLFDSYLCPYCTVEIIVGSRATLIVTPSSISHQWEEEVKKHIKNDRLKMFVYKGVKEQKFIPPSILANNDVILTTYEIFRKEIKYVGIQRVNTPHSHHRHPKRYAVLPSPLTAILWWRICLDEAQMVECSTTKSSQMVLSLNAVNRWCVTGTPIQKSVEDLYGLFLFLEYEPFNVKKWWREALYKPFANGNLKPLAEAMKSVFWRTMKKHVSDQINIPEQRVVDRKLCFTSLEKYFYDRQHEACFTEFQEKIKKLDGKMKLKSLDQASFSRILIPLRKLRLACCHPQAVKGQFVPLCKSIMSMEEIAEALVKKVEIDCEDAHRGYIASLNGLAGVYIIQNLPQKAKEMYQKVMKSVEEHLPLFKTDKLQQLHALHNLAEMLKLHELGIGTASDTDSVCNSSHALEIQSSDTSVLCTAKFPDDDGMSIKSIEEKELGLYTSYLSKYKAQIDDAQKELAIRGSQVETLKKQVALLRGETWWKSVINDAMSMGKERDLVTKIEMSLNDTAKNVVSLLAGSITTGAGISLVCYSMLEELFKSRNSLGKAMADLTIPPSRQHINDCIGCHLRPPNVVVVRCIFCKVEAIFNQYENKLYNILERKKKRARQHEELLEEEKNEAVKRIGTWADGPIEQILKILLNFSRMHKGSARTFKYGSNTVELFDALKKEFKAFRTSWMHKRDYVSAVDELEMAVMRIRIRFPDEEPADPPVLYIIESDNVCAFREQLTMDKNTCEKNLAEKISKLLFLKNVVKAYAQPNESLLKDTCPICHQTYERQWCVLTCGHRTCVTCLQFLISSKASVSSNPQTQCPVCRVYTSNSDIFFTDQSATCPLKNSIKGSYSTKVVGLIDDLLELRKEDSRTKTIVFSSWDDILNIIADGLKENGIPYVDLTNKKNFKMKIENFRKRSEVNVLLLPLQSGGNGLNLIEATNVIFVEPVLNNAKYEQAVGRIHRIGQEKETFVYRYYIGCTVEERLTTMAALTRPIGLKEDVEKMVTVQELQKLFEQF